MSCSEVTSDCATAEDPIACEDYEELELLQVGTQLMPSLEHDTKADDTVLNADAEDGEYYWQSRSRGLTRSGSAAYTAPSNFSAGPSWTWKNELHEQVRHSPLIDNSKNVYITTTSRVRKFNSDGELLWSWQSTPEEGTMNACPTLYKGTIIVVKKQEGQATAISLKMIDGTVDWQHTYLVNHNGDASSTSVVNGMLIFGAQRGKAAGNNLVVAANATNGDPLWEYYTDDVFWNFSPSAHSDGSLIFSCSCGATFRISSEGKEIWVAGLRHSGSKMCTPSGGTLGPNGLFYAEYSQADDDNDGVLAAYQLSDGALKWKKHLGRRGSQYPAVGMLNGHLAVIATVGDNPAPPLPKVVERMILQKMPTPGQLSNAIIALDAASGTILWQFEEPGWPHVAGAGEIESLNASRPDWPKEGACFPDANSIPLLLGDGTVYSASSHDGVLRAIQDKNHNGAIEASEVTTFETGNCFLNSPSAAPGMLVVAPCWGDVYVFK